MADLTILHTGSGHSSTRFLADEDAASAIEVRFLDGLEDAFAAGGPEIGKYATAPEYVVWRFTYPDGDEVTVAGDGTIADPLEFTPDRAGRYLVRLTATPYINDGFGNPTLVESTSQAFSVLLEVLDPHVLGHPEALTSGASVPAPGETSEADTDTGWSLSTERFLSAVSKLLAVGSTMVVTNTSLAPITRGTVVTPDTSVLRRWKMTDCGDALWHTYILGVVGTNATEASVVSGTLLLALDDIPAGGRGYVITSGIVPYNTGAFTLGDTLYVGASGALIKVAPTSPPGYVRIVGKVKKVGAASGDGCGSVYFFGVADDLADVARLADLSGFLTASPDISAADSVWTLRDNRAAALSMDTTGLAGVLKVVTTDGEEALATAGKLSYAKLAFQPVETLHNSPGATCIIDWNTANNQQVLLDAASCVFTFTAPTSGGVCHLTLRMRQPVAGGKAVTWPATVKWSGGTEPTWNTTAGRENYAFFYWNGTRYIGSGVVNVTP